MTQVIVGANVVTYLNWFINKSKKSLYVLRMYGTEGNAPLDLGMLSAYFTALLARDIKNAVPVKQGTGCQYVVHPTTKRRNEDLLRLSALNEVTAVSIVLSFLPNWTEYYIQEEITVQGYAPKKERGRKKHHDNEKELVTVRICGTCKVAYIPR